MKRIQERLIQLRIWQDTKGQDLVEYALAAGLVAVAAVACMPGLSGTVNHTGGTLVLDGGMLLVNTFSGVTGN